MIAPTEPLTDEEREVLRAWVVRCNPAVVLDWRRADGGREATCAETLVLRLLADHDRLAARVAELEAELRTARGATTMAISLDKTATAFSMTLDTGEPCSPDLAAALRRAATAETAQRALLEHAEIERAGREAAEKRAAELEAAATERNDDAETIVEALRMQRDKAKARVAELETELRTAREENAACAESYRQMDKNHAGACKARDYIEGERDAYKLHDEHLSKLLAAAEARIDEQAREIERLGAECDAKDRRIYAVESDAGRAIARAEAAERECDQEKARADRNCEEADALRDAIDENLPEYRYDRHDGTEDEANPIERVEEAGRALTAANLRAEAAEHNLACAGDQIAVMGADYRRELGRVERDNAALRELLREAAVCVHEHEMRCETSVPCDRCLLVDRVAAALNDGGAKEPT